MSKKLEDELTKVIEKALAEAYIKINKRFPSSINHFNSKYDREIEAKFVKMLQDTVREELWLIGDIGADFDD